MRIYVDIDGTMTKAPNQSWGEPNFEVIDKVKKLISEGHRIIIWSVGGTSYAKEFAKKYNINAFACIGKPDMMIDDKPNIRTNPIPLLSPDEFLKKEITTKE